MDKIMIKGQPIEDWKSWLESELIPPVKCSEQTKYVLEAFLELINALA